MSAPQPKAVSSYITAPREAETCKDYGILDIHSALGKFSLLHLVQSTPQMIKLEADLRILVSNANYSEVVTKRLLSDYMQFTTLHIFNTSIRITT